MTTEEVEPPAGKSVGRNVSTMFVAQIITWTISLSLVVLVPRFLGPTAVGQLQITEAIWAIGASFAAFGTQSVVTLSIARDRSKGANVVGAVLYARLALLAIVSIVVAIVAGVVYDRDLAVLFVVVGINAWLLTVAEIGAAGLQGFEDLTLLSRGTIVAKALNAAAVVIVLVLGGGIIEVAIVFAGGNLVYGLLLFRYLRRFSSFAFRSSFGEALKMARAGLPYLFGTVTMIVYQSLDAVIISLLVNEEQVGWYATADRLFTTSGFIPTTVMVALFPVLARLSAEDESAAQDMVHEAFRSLMLLAVPIGVGILLVSSPVALLLFGEEFREVGPVFGAFGVVLMIMFGTILLGQYAVASGREKFYFSLLAIATVATVPLDLVLVPWTNREFGNGAIGGALAYVITEGAVLAVSLRVLAPHLISRATLVRLVKCALAAGLMALAVWPLRGVFVFVPIAVGAVVYILAIMMLRTLDDSERDTIVGGFGRIASKFRPGSAS